MGRSRPHRAPEAGTYTCRYEAAEGLGASDEASEQTAGSAHSTLALARTEVTKPNSAPADWPHFFEHFACAGSGLGGLQAVMGFSVGEPARWVLMVKAWAKWNYLKY